MTAIVVHGSGKLEAEDQSHELQEGYIFFIAPNTEITYETDDGLEVYAAFVWVNECQDLVFGVLNSVLPSGKYNKDSRYP